MAFVSLSVKRTTIFCVFGCIVSVSRKTPATKLMTHETQSALGSWLRVTRTRASCDFCTDSFFPPAMLSYFLAQIGGSGEILDKFVSSPVKIKEFLI